MRCKCCDVVLTGSEVGRKRKVVEYGKEYWFEDGLCNRCVEASSVQEIITNTSWNT